MRHQLAGALQPASLQPASPSASQPFSQPALQPFSQSALQAASQQPPGPAPPASTHRALLDRYCVTCHNEKLRTADLTLDTMDVVNVSEGAEEWERVVRKLHARAMPPAGMPRPDQAALDSFVTYLETEMDRAAAAAPNPGRPVIHRLNRTEW